MELKTQRKVKNLNDTKDASLYMDEMIRELLKEKDEILIELTLKRLLHNCQIID